jgi:hypothetical protein
MLDLDDNAPELLLNKIKIAEQEAKDLQLQHERLQSRAISNQSLKTGIPTANFTNRFGFWRDRINDPGCYRS